MTFNLSESEMQTYKSLYNNKGARIEFFCDNCIHSGIIDAILPERRIVKLKHGKIGDHYHGNLRFKFREISSFKVIESAESLNRYPKNNYLLNILRNSRRVDRAACSKILYSNSDVDADEFDNETDEENKGEKLVLDLPEHLENKIPNKYTVIDTIDDDFNEAVRSIFNQEVIGVAFHGSQISRFGKLNFVCVSTNAYLFVFDIHKLGKEAFDKGLKQVLESKSVKKVIHDCRLPSDCLAHQYNTVLCHIFDTKVVDFVINRQHYTGKEEFHSWPTLDCLLRLFLKVPQKYLYQRETTNSDTEIKRPITNAYLYDILKSVCYLIILQEELLKELYKPLYRAIGFHKFVLADSDTQLIDFLGRDLSKPDTITPSLLMNGIQLAYFRKIKKNASLECQFIHPQTGKVIYPEVAPDLTTPVKSSLSEEKKSILSFDEKGMNECYEVSKEKDYVLKSNNQNENLSEEDETNNLFTKLSFREMDNIYHKLVYKMYQTQNIINVKPSVDNRNSGLSDNKYFAACSNNSDLSVKNTDTESSENCCKSNRTDECSDVWSKLREEIMKEKTEYPQYWQDRKITFLPG